MSYSVIDALTNDALLAGRVRAATTEQAETYIADARPDWQALSREALRGGAEPYLAFTRYTAAAPGIADKAGDPPDQTQVTDGDILTVVQNQWGTVASLYYDADGNPLTGDT